MDLANQRLSELLTELVKNNRVILLVFGILFLVYLYLYANEFEIRTTTKIWIIPIEIFVALIMFILLANLKTKRWFKIMSLAAFLGAIMVGIPQTGLWKYSLSKYVSKEKREYRNFVNEIDKIDEVGLSYISCLENQINSRPKLDREKVKKFTNSICKYIDELDCIEVSLNRLKGKYLFVMSRSIDNGYGLLYCKENLKVGEISTERINGLKIISVLKVERNWYYVSFT